MIYKKSSRLMIHGLGQQAAAVYNSPDGTVKEGRWAVADGSGGAAEPAYVLGCYDAPFGVAYATAVLASAADYDLSGTAVPVGSVVYLSRAGVDTAPEELEAGVFASVQSDDTGAWSYEGLEGFDGTLWAWVKVPATVLDTLNAGITCSMEVTVRPVESNAVVYAEQAAELDTLGGWPTITLRGTCPASAAQVRVSKHALLACPTCTCAVCGGSGMLLNHESCGNCEGTGKVDTTCSSCRGTGVRQKTCPDCSGDGIADVECQDCGGTGIVEQATACPDCEGTGTVDGAACETCGGTGSVVESVQCAACSGKGKVNGSESCTTCGGTGKVDVTCSSCKGTGLVKTSCSACGGDGLMDVSCPDCGGDGIVGASPCPTCGGRRWVIGPLTLDTLTPTVKASAEPADGSYSMTFEGEYHENSQSAKYPAPPWPKWKYIVWCEADSGELTVAMTSTNNQCLSGDTRITLAGGGTKRLAEIRPGDLLLAGDGTPTQVRRVARGRWNDHHTLYRFEDGTVVDEIHAHRFYNCEAGFWQLLERWNIGDHARRQDGAEVALVSVERVEEPAEMFGLWTESRDYWANGLLSGETAANQALLADATAEQAADMMASLEESAVLQLLGVEEMLP